MGNERGRPDPAVSAQGFDASGKRVALNSVLNLTTGAVLLVLNLIVIPLLLAEYGLELFGVLSVTWMILANLSWLDLGLSRATAVFVARELGVGDTVRAVQWARASGAALLAMGLVGAIAVFVAAPSLVSALKVTPEKQANVILSLQIFALALPLDFVGRSLVGTLQACQRFKWLNFNDLMTGLATILAYGAGVLLKLSFVEMAVALLSVRLLTFGLNLTAVLRVVPSIARLRLDVRDGLAKLKRMTRFGAWLSLSGLLGGVLLYFDRWVIGILIGVATLSFYSVPMSLLSRLFVFPQSVVSTLFPALSTLHARSDWSIINDYFVRSNRYVLLMLAPAAFVLFLWSRELLTLWISSEFAAIASPAMRILVVGFAVGLLAPLSAAVFDAAGRPDLLAKIYAVQVPLNIILVYVLTKELGLIGAGLSFAFRSCVETLTIWIVLFRSLPQMKVAALLSEARRVAPVVAIFVMASASTLQMGIFARAAITVLGLVAAGLCAVRLTLDQQDRQLLAQLWVRARGLLP